MSDVKVRDWMHVGVISCRPTTSVAEVAELMKAHDISAVVVVDERGYAIGLISRTDLVNATFVQPYLGHWRGMAARHLMSSPVITAGADTPIEQATALIHDRRIHRLVVTERDGAGERPIGILSVTDVVRHLGETKEGLDG